MISGGGLKSVPQKLQKDVYNIKYIYPQKSVISLKIKFRNQLAHINMLLNATV